MDLLATFPWATIGPSGALMLTIVLIINGNLHSDKEFRVILDDRDQWRKTALTLLQATVENTHSAKVAARLLDSIPQVPPDGPT